MIWIVSLVSFLIGIVVGIVGVAVAISFSEGLIPAKLRDRLYSSDDG